MAINITAKGDPEKKLKWAFKMYDVDGNGEIDKGEMLQIIQVKNKTRSNIIDFSIDLIYFCSTTTNKNSPSTI